MKRFILFISLVISVSFSVAQPLNQIVNDRNGNPMLVGCCTKEALMQEPFASWFVPNYTNYKVDTVVANQIRQHVRNREFVLFLGTWCGDSRREVPRLYKLLEYCGVEPEQIKLIMVSNHDTAYKQSPTHEEQGLNILRVPTLLVLENHTELNRIVEYPVESLEKDLLKILGRREYKHPYNKSK